MGKLKVMLLAALLLTFVAAPAVIAAEVIRDGSTDNTKAGWWKCGWAQAYQHNYGLTYSYGYVSGIGWMRAYDDHHAEVLLSATSQDKWVCAWFTSSTRYTALRTY